MGSPGRDANISDWLLFGPETSAPSPPSGLSPSPGGLTPCSLRLITLLPPSSRQSWPSCKHELLQLFCFKTVDLRSLSLLPRGRPSPRRPCVDSASSAPSPPPPRHSECIDIRPSDLSPFPPHLPHLSFPPRRVHQMNGLLQVCRLTALLSLDGTLVA